MSKQPNMTEPLVVPAKPDVKPVPKRIAPKPKPRRGDPWTVPGPKVKPTPKAHKIKEMTTENNNKRLITTMGELDFCKLMFTKEEFYEKCELSSELVAKLCAKKSNTIVDTTDRLPNAEELKALGF